MPNKFVKRLVNWFRPSSRRLVVALTAEGFSCAIYSVKERYCRVDYANFVKNYENSEFTPPFLTKKLVGLVKNENLDKARCDVVLGSDFYRIFLQSLPPQISKQEQHKALLFQIKDLVDVPVEEIVIDEFEAGISSGEEKIYVVSAERKLINSLVDCFARGGLNLFSIDIQDCVMAGLSKLGEVGEYVAQLAIDRGRCILQIVKDGLICFTRSFFVDSFNDDPQVLINEMKRSLDFAQDLMGNIQVKAVNVFPDFRMGKVQQLSVEQALNLPFRVLDFTQNPLFKKKVQLVSGVNVEESWLSIGMVYNLMNLEE